MHWEGGLCRPRKQHNIPKGCAHWLDTLPSVKTNAKRTETPKWNLAEEGSGLEESRVYSRSQECSHKGTGGREQQANLLSWKAECIGNTREEGFVLLPWGLILKMLQHSNTPLSWNSLKKRIKIAVMVVSRCLPAQCNSCIHFHLQGITAHTDLRLGTKRKWALLYLLSFAGLTLPPREINAYVFTNRANGRHAYLFYIYLQCSQELKISPEMKAYVGIKSRRCSSLTAKDAFRTLLASVFISVAFLRYKDKEEVGRAGKEEMSGGRQWKAATMCLGPGGKRMPDIQKQLCA